MKKAGQLLSAMVAQNITVIIVAGIIREIFGVYGWWYNHQILLLVNPIYNTLLPILIAYTGGRLISGQRGGVAASIVTYGLTLASSAPAILGAMIVGPLVGYMTKYVDLLVKRRLPIAGYELLVTNVLLSIPTIFLTIVCFLYVGQSYASGVEWTVQMLEKIIYSPYLPLAATLIEPLKVFFFNNILNYGLLGPLGINQAKELGKSIFFLLEANPGPGLGVLLAYWLKTKGNQRRGAKMGTFIHIFGGIHEVYFPYILLNPKLLIAVILGGVSGIFVFQNYYVGLVSIASPGSIFLFVGLAPKQDMVFVFLGVIISALVSFLTSIMLLKQSDLSPTEDENRRTILNFTQLQEIERIEHYRKDASEEGSMKEEAPRTINKIIFVCEAGLGSSAMGAAMLKGKLRKMDLDIAVDNASLNDIPEDADILICHRQLLKDVKLVAGSKKIIDLNTFTDRSYYEDIANDIKEGRI
ncbi:PTS transporter subunit EIIC [Thalassobacillus sp. B23F22_16]|uniref:PTS transporter subunit EIIC n=1 Tax=Thalassobacillus sp. B23F22_16 TaxID=3459513 RepID=UPI00373E580A